jgi:hypothetical protein
MGIIGIIDVLPPQVVDSGSRKFFERLDIVGTRQ